MSETKRLMREIETSAKALFRDRFPDRNWAFLDPLVKDTWAIEAFKARCLKADAELAALRDRLAPAPPDRARAVVAAARELLLQIDAHTVARIPWESVYVTAKLTALRTALAALDGCAPAPAGTAGDAGGEG